MNEIISSKDTTLIKYIFPTFVLLFGACIAIVLWNFDLKNHKGESPSELFKVLMTLLPIILFFSSVAVGCIIKYVSVNQQQIIIKGYFKEICIPLSEIESIERNLFLTRPLAFTLILKNSSMFGKKIHFFPVLPYFRSPQTTQEVIDRLREKLLIR
jgi:hypothetical protein